MELYLAEVFSVLEQILHDGVTNLHNVPHSTFYQSTFSEQVYVVTYQLLQEGSETWDLSHSIDIVTLRPLCDKPPCHTTNLATIDKCTHVTNS